MAGQTTSYVYDTLGNLTRVTKPNGQVITYTIDGRGRRVGKSINGVRVKGRLYADQLRPIAELTGTGAVLTRFVYGTKSNVPEYMVRSNVTYRIVSDHLGTPRVVMHASTGAIVQRLDVQPFGEIIQDSNPGWQPFGFAGGLYDPDTGLLRFGARDYDPQIGRWTAKDPVMFDDGPNLSVYVGNDPINYVDAKGTDARQTIVDFSAGLGDALLLGFGDDLRNALGIDGVDTCSGAYSAGALSSFAFGAARLGYAAAAKGISLAASSGAAASAGRETLKKAFRGGIAKNWRKFDPAGKSDAALRAAAGRTNLGVNAYGAGVAAAGAAGSSGDCGCR